MTEEDKKDLITEISANVIAALLEYLEDNVSIQQDATLDPSNTESELYEKAAIIKNKLDKVFKKYKEL